MKNEIGQEERKHREREREREKERKRKRKEDILGAASDLKLTPSVLDLLDSEQGHILLGSSLISLNS